MKHKFTVLIFCFFTFLGKFAFANPYQVGSQQWHNYNAAIWSEQDKIKAEREAMKQQQSNQNNISQNNEQHYNRWSVFVYNEDTGDWAYHIDHWIDGSSKDAIKVVKKEFKEAHKKKGVEANKHIYWEGAFRGIVAFGQNRQSGKWEAYFMYGASEKNKQKLMNECEAQSDYCKLIID